MFSVLVLGMHDTCICRIVYHAWYLHLLYCISCMIPAFVVLYIMHDTCICCIVYHAWYLHLLYCISCMIPAFVVLYIMHDTCICRTVYHARHLLNWPSMEPVHGVHNSHTCISTCQTDQAWESVWSVHYSHTYISTCQTAKAREPVQCSSFTYIVLTFPPANWVSLGTSPSFTYLHFHLPNWPSLGTSLQHAWAHHSRSLFSAELLPTVELWSVFLLPKSHPFHLAEGSYNLHMMASHHSKSKFNLIFVIVTQYFWCLYKHTENYF